MRNHQKDYEERLKPSLTTKLLWDAVPVVKESDFKYLEVSRGHCQSILPLNLKTSNQHGTHQALLLAMAADYTGGLAFASLIYGEPILGVHEVTNEKGMSLWLIKSDMTYLCPSVEDVYIEANIPLEKEEALNRRYHQGKALLLDVTISFMSPLGKEVAKGTFRYFSKKKSLLNPPTKTGKINIMYEHMLKTSAKLIARLRYEEGLKENALFKDEISRVVAGKQGYVIASRFNKILPELQLMVAARTAHLDEEFSKVHSKIEQVVFLGAGLDFRIYRNSAHYQDKKIFELDLAEMIQEREELEKEHQTKPSHFNTPTRVPCNFINDSIVEKLIASNLSPEHPTFIIFEGCSMYFSREENKKILTEVSDLLSFNSESILWMDLLSHKALENDNHPLSVTEFLSNIAKLGEPFIYGFKENDSLLKEVNLSSLNTSNPLQFPSLARSGSREVLDLYSFGTFKC